MSLEQAMAQSEHAHDHDPATHRRRDTEKYCAYCGTKLRDDPPASTHRVGARLRARTFCDRDCERAWDIDEN
jgi:hypothetical protein